MRFTPALTSKLADANAETVRQNVDRRIGELQSMPAAALIVVGDFAIPNNGSVMVKHQLGRRPLMVILSPPTIAFGTAVGSSGVIYDATGNGVDRTQAVFLAAFGYGATVTVTVAVL